MRTLNLHETADEYGGVIANLAVGWRVVVCKDAIQWIVQRRRKGGAERPWRAVGYFRTRRALIRLCAISCAQIDPSTRSMLNALPVSIEDKRTCCDVQQAASIGGDDPKEAS